MRLFWILLLFLAAPPAAAQFSTVAGELSDQAGAPVSAAAVLLSSMEGGSVGTTSNASGRFAFLNVRPGRYVLEVSHLAFLPARDTLDVGFDEVHSMRFTLEALTASLDDVTVEDARTGDSTVVVPGGYRVRPSDLAQSPSPGPSADLMSFIQTVPGALRVGDSGGHLFVRGGTPTQNLVLVDGMPVYQPFHIVGFYSAFPADIVSYADVYAGGFGARYGGRLSSVIDVSTRNGNKRRVAGAVSLAPFLSAARLEIPIQKDRVSILFSGRESVIERIGPALTNAEFPFRFGDYFGKFHAFLNQTSSFSATALRTYDRGTFAMAGGGERVVSWRNTAYGGRYVYLPPDYPVMTQFAVYVSRYASDFSSDESMRHSSTTGVNGDISFTYLLGEHQLDFGIFGRSNGFDYAIGRSLTGSGSENVTEGGGYVDFSWSASRFVGLRAGVRVHAFSSGISTAVEPRLQILIEPGGWLHGHAIGVSGGVYHQQIMGLTALEDLTDVFIAWAPTPDQRAVPRAVHLIASWSYRLGRFTVLRAEGYAKTMSDLAAPRYDRLTDTLFPIDHLDGTARGVDLYVRHAGPRLFLSAGYALASVRYEGAVPWPGHASAGGTLDASFHPPHDRRHQVNLAAAYSLGTVRFKALWQFGSGHPFSQIHGFHPRIEVGTSSDALGVDTGETAVVFAAPFGGRTPSYHRLDVSAERAFPAGPTTITAQAGVVNAYDRNNLFDFDLLTGERVDQLPMIPYVGIGVTFN